METGADQLNNAVQLIKAGNKQAALPILREVVQADPNNENAWLWLFSCVEKPEQKKFCLQQALKINPDNQNTQKALDKLTASLPTPPAPAAPPPPVMPPAPATAPPEPSRSQEPPAENLPEPSRSPEPPAENLPEPSRSPEPPAAPSEPSQAPEPPAENPPQPFRGLEAPQTPVRQSNTLRNMLVLLGIVVILLCCLVGGTFGWNFVRNQFFSQSNQVLPSISGDATQVGVFVIGDNGSPLKMERSQGAPSQNGTPAINNTMPSFVLNDPEIDPPNLIFGKYGNSGIQKIPLNLTRSGTLYQANMSQLSAGLYCFAQYGAMVAPGQADMWCVQIGKLP